MAGIDLTGDQRSQLLQQLLSQQGRAPNIQSTPELAARLGEQLLRKKKTDTLREEQSASQKTTRSNEIAALQKLLGGGDVDFQGRPIESAQGDQQNNINLAQALGQLPSDNPTGSAITAELIRRSSDEKKQVKPVIREVKKGGEFVTQMIDPTDGTVIKELGRGPRRTENIQGTPSDFDLSKSDKSKTIKEFRAATAATAKALRQGIELKNIAATDPVSLGKPGSIAKLGNTFVQTVTGLASLAGIEGIDAKRDLDDFAFDGFTGNMRETAINNTQFQAGVYGIAFATAVAVQGSRPTDKDIQAFIDQIAGQSSDPIAFAKTINGFMQQSVQSLRDQAFLNGIPDNEMKNFNNLIDPLIKQFQPSTEENEARLKKLGI